MARVISYHITLWDEEICVSVNLVCDDKADVELLELKHFDKDGLNDALDWVHKKSPTSARRD